jgi:cysteinyl-tRNA synthetase
MLRLYDPRSRLPAPITGTRRGELWMHVSGPDLDRRPHLGDLRAALLPDLIRRCAQQRGLAVTIYESVATADEPILAALRANRSALNIHPADRTFPASEPIALLAARGWPGWTSQDGPAFDITLRAASARATRGAPGTLGSPAAPGTPDAAAANGAPDDPEPAPAAVVVAHEAAPTASVTVDGREVADPDEDPAEGIAWLSDVTEPGLDPLALRLAFLRHRYREPANLTWDGLVAADRAVGRWREMVAAWATEPSAPLARPYADAVLGAFEDDLDTPAALRHLGTLETDSAVPPGAKFETFAYLDHLLGLDLAREIGRY